MTAPVGWMEATWLRSRCADVAAALVCGQLAVVTRRYLSDASPLPHLGLAGDGDDVDLVRSIEHATGLSFGPGPHQWTTMGDMEDAVLARIPSVAGRGRCASMMAFHTLRAVLRRHPGTPHDIAPATRLRDLGVGTPRNLTALLHADIGLHSAPLGRSRIGWAGHAMVGAGVLGPAVLGHLWPALLIVPGLLLLELDPRSFGSLTVGELASDVADRNHAHFAGNGADLRPATVRAVLRRLVGRVARVPPARIDRATRFFSR